MNEKEWNKIELSNFDLMFFKLKEWKWMKMNENEWNVNNLVWKQHGENGIESFYDNITIKPPILK